MHNEPNRIYLCKNKEEWERLMLYLHNHEEVDYFWGGYSRPIDDEGNLTHEFSEDYAEAVYIERGYRLSYSDLRYALEQPEHASLPKYWVSELGLIINKPVMTSSRLPEL